jgi:hypothetical protein
VKVYRIFMAFGQSIENLITNLNHLNILTLVYIISVDLKWLCSPDETEILTPASSETSLVHVPTSSCAYSSDFDPLPQTVVNSAET